MIAVLAGNYRQFRQWCDENRMQENRDARYIDRMEAIMGIEFDEYTKVGTWWEASDEAKEAFRYSGLVYRTVDGIRTSKAV